MTFIHAPTLFSLALGGGLTLWDLLRYQQRALSETLEDIATLRLTDGRMVLDYLETSGVVEVRRDSWGDIVRVTLRADPATFLASVIELGRQEFSPPADAPLSN